MSNLVLTLPRVALTCLLLAAASRPASAQTPSSPSLATAGAQATAVFQEDLAARPAARVTAAGGVVLLDAILDAARLERPEVIPGQALAVTLQYPLGMAGAEVVADPLDGGRIDGRPWRKLTVNPLGRVLFTFTAGTNPGVYTVELRPDDGTSATLEFMVKAAPAN